MADLTFIRLTWRRHESSLYVNVGTIRRVHARGDRLVGTVVVTDDARLDVDEAVDEVMARIAGAFADEDASAPPPPGTCGALVVTHEIQGSIADGQMCRRVAGPCPWPRWTRPSGRVDPDERCAWEREQGAADV